ncbi:hypothetical protein EN833_07730 [Mesorhizobium sp. M4B.F.Ca.ET.190.01.1.1]|uniref:hypothetical protein n=1 Tax=unclassified Mesorhizobium TaxID=325217 RepID=UPI00109332DB|nr:MULTISPECIES: hypothetical protein [unclassified Mesorhizobium]TGR13056.1 hypothetical protein EN843_07725 [Mesorhizobium sp. M4B.F.Ca.ET.200.01.1.1]TGS21267.1 hypothetical protein EN833_07730 [Mesorhizobium sp. M4B.F.Ca.ET.190.01.1.1]TGT32830.1 hypothetical protein EN815_10270 [Mesorhizobium sp. M4B.F.Ca.ET.172.01.1.1]
MKLNADEKRRLSEFLRSQIERFTFRHRKDVDGVASGNLFGILWVTDRGLAKKVEDRVGLVSAARDLGFVIDAGKGGSRAGTVVWEYIDLPKS